MVVIQHFGEDVTDYVLTGCFGVLFIVATIQLLRNQLYSSERGWTQRKMFHGLILFSNLFRVIFFSMQPSIREKTLAISPDLDFVFNAIPGVLYLSTFVLLIFFWAEFFYFAHNKSLPSLQRLRPLFIWGNALVYFIVSVLLIVVFFVPNEAKTAITLSVVLFIAFMSVIAAGGFLLFGTRLLIIFRRFPISSKRRRALLSKVGWVTVVCALDFLTRAVIIVWSGFHIETRLDWRFAFIYYVLLEIFPLSLMLWLLRKVPKTAAAAQSQAEPGKDRAPLIDEAG